MADRVLIIGGGLAGLAAARTLASRGTPFLLLEAADRVGGRLKTDLVDGFRLDRGFQVHFPAYPTAARLLDQSALQLRPFRRGALIFDGARMRRIDAGRPVEMAFAPWPSLGDKLRTLRWQRFVASRTRRELDAMPDETTLRHLEEYGFSRDYRERFLRPFFAGIFIDPDLEVSRRQFAFIFKMLGEGPAALPAEGIEAIPRQLAACLPPGTIRTFTRAAELHIEGGILRGVRLGSGERLSATRAILATDPLTTQRLLGIAPPEGHKVSTCVYFETASPVVDGAYLILNGAGSGEVNEVAPLTNAAPEYGPRGRHLFSATILRDPGGSDSDVFERVRSELARWFPKQRTEGWSALRVDRIAYAQMPQPPGFQERRPPHRTTTRGLFLAGEVTTDSSIEGALASGVAAAEALLRDAPPER